jgi:hypothetical protein
MKKVLVFLLILAFACPVLAEHYGSSYYQKNKRFALQGKGTPDPVYAALKELEGSGTANDSSKGFSPAIWDTSKKVCNYRQIAQLLLLTPISICRII